MAECFEKIIHLSPFEEAIGVLYKLYEVDSIWIADIGQVHAWLPDEIASKLNGLQGQRIGVLRTDCDYRFRVIGDSTGMKSEKANPFHNLITYKSRAIERQTI